MSSIAGSIVCASRAPSRSGVDCGTPSTMYNGCRPRSDSPELVIFCGYGENAGIRLASTCEMSWVSASCWSSWARSITVMVLGRADSESGMRLVEAETVTGLWWVALSCAARFGAARMRSTAAARIWGEGIRESVDMDDLHGNANHSQLKDCEHGRCRGARTI